MWSISINGLNLLSECGGFRLFKIIVGGSYVKNPKFSFGLGSLKVQYLLENLGFCHLGFVCLCSFLGILFNTRKAKSIPIEIV
jgi:hypothetical protein